MSDPEDAPQVRAAHQLVTDLLGPRAAAVDATAVPRSHLDALAGAGLLGLGIVDEVPPAVARRVGEVVAGADLATWFVAVQHASPLRLVSEAVGPARERWLPGLASGRTVAGVAFAHVRRWPERPVAATRLDRAWRLDGTAPWFTGWGISDVLAIGATTADGRVVMGLLAAAEGGGLTAGEPLRLAAMSATRTVALHLDGVRLPDDDVVLVRPIGEWRAQDARTASTVVPAVPGVTAAAIAGLAGTATRRGSSAGPALVDELARRLDEVRADVGRLEVPDPDVSLDERWAVRAGAQRLMLDATSAYLAAAGGAGLALGHEAQRLARGALFLLVQAQTPPAREALLASYVSQPHG